MPYYVYILECANKALYTGITTDLKRRFAQHKAGEGGRYTRSNRPTKIRYHEIHNTRSEATKREIQIKRWPRTKKIALIKENKGILKATARLKIGNWTAAATKKNSVSLVPTKYNHAP
ncbi:MAG: GIY-YIG nuclease family protein [Candidatus Margulisiibacteriota bacterium]